MNGYKIFTENSDIYSQNHNLNLGPLRFKRPTKKADWDSTFDASKQPNACMQLPDLTFGNFSGSQMWNPNTNISEDCLYLNVYSPRARSSSEKV